MVKTEENGDSNANTLEPEQFRKMFIGGLTSSTSDEMLKDFYSKWGQLLDCVVMRDPTTKRSRGFGFVSYAKQSEVDEAMANRPHVIDGKTVDPKRAVPREQSERNEATVSSKRLYVSGVREEHTEDMFKEHFSKYGNILKCEIINDKTTGKPRGFAFITFDDYDSVDKCVLIKSHMIHNYRCDVKKALSKEEMAKQSERERMDRGLRSRGPPNRGSNGYGPDRSYGGPNWGGPGGPSNYGGGGGYSSGYGGYGNAPPGGRWSGDCGGWGNAPSGGSGKFRIFDQGGWGHGGGQGGWNQGSHGGGTQSWGGSGGWGGRGY